MTEITPDAVLDVRNEACPYPFIRTKWLMEQIAIGEVIKVVANDPDALENIDAWTKRSGDRILRIEYEGDTCIIYLKKKR
ncbi:MAG: sulfurtransferase TusA family protein [Candidatus Methanoperedens sp.]|nr:sulfurtransferase TusA family protein [Candidatus Methanoperedens sp.]